MREEASRRTLNLDNDDEPASRDEMALMMAAEKVFPPNVVEYKVESTGARVSLKGAKQLIFLYCNKLPSDKCLPIVLPLCDCQCNVMSHNTLASTKRVVELYVVLHAKCLIRKIWGWPLHRVSVYGCTRLQVLKPDW